MVGAWSVHYTIYLWHVPKLIHYLCLRVFRIVIYGKSNSSQLVYLSFFVCSVTYSSLTSELWILFWTLRDIRTVLKYYRIFRNFLYRKINFKQQPLFSLNVFKLQKKNSRHVQKLKHYLYFRPVSVFIYGKFNSNYYIRMLLFFSSL